LVPLAAASLLALLLKIGVDVARTMYDMSNVQMAARPVFIRIAQKDDIVAERCAANIVAEFGARAAHHTGQPGQALAVIGELIDELVGDGAAFALDIGRDLGNGAARGGPVNKARHLRLARLIKAVEMIACVTAHVIRREVAALGLGRRELGAQLDEFCLIDCMAYGVFGRGEAAGSKFGLHPLGSICGELDFHMASFQRR